MAINDSSGYIGLGSRLFLGKETVSWGTKPATEGVWEQYNVYNQEGSRPQKVTTPIEVSQLYPSMVRRKPIKNSVTVEGSYTFSLPTSGFDPFAQLITGSTAGTLSTVSLHGTTSVATLAGTESGSTNVGTGLLYFITASTQAGSLIGKNINVSGITTTNLIDDELELAIINGVHTVLYHDWDGNIDDDQVPGDGEPTWVVTSTVFDVANFAGTENSTTPIFNTGGTYELQETVSTSYSFAQTIGIQQIAHYSGMMAQSATFNVSPDDVANVEISFLGKDETISNPTVSTLNTLFNGGSAQSVIQTSEGVISGVNTAVFDNCTEFYPSWATTLFINKKNGTEFQIPADGAWSSGTGVTAFVDNATSTVPFSDLSITINNNLEFPAYLNGSINKNKPVQTTYKEVTGSITIPYNQYTDYIISSIFDQDSFEFRIQFQVDGGETITLIMPEVCITGDSLADIPAGEITLPINFASYAPKNPATGHYMSESPFKMVFGGSQD